MGRPWVDPQLGAHSWGKAPQRDNTDCSLRQGARPLEGTYKGELFTYFFGFFGSIWTIWARTGPAQALEEREKFIYGFLWVHIWAHMGPYGPLWANIWALMGLYGPIWAYMGPYGHIWAHMGPIWAHMGPYGPYGGPYGTQKNPIWSHMASYCPI